MQRKTPKFRGSGTLHARHRESSTARDMLTGGLFFCTPTNANTERSWTIYHTAHPYPIIRTRNITIAHQLTAALNFARSASPR